MATRTNQTPCPFTPKEREYIRRELDIFFGTLPSLADGFQLRTWRGGPHARQPKIPPPLRTMLDRGLMVIRTGADGSKTFSRSLREVPGPSSSTVMSLKFLDTAHVKDLLALLRFVENPRDRVAGFRVMQLLPGVGP